MLPVQNMAFSSEWTSLRGVSASGNTASHEGEQTIQTHSICQMRCGVGRDTHTEGPILTFQKRQP